MTPRERKYHWRKKKWTVETTILPISLPKNMDLYRGFDIELSNSIEYTSTPAMFDGPRLPTYTMDEYNMFTDILGAYESRQQFYPQMSIREFARRLKQVNNA